MSEEKAAEIDEKFNNIATEELFDLRDRMCNRIDEILDECTERQRFLELKPGFVDTYSQDVSEVAFSSNVSEEHLQAFFSMMQLETEDRLKEHEMGIAESEDTNPHLQRP